MKKYLYDGETYLSEKKLRNAIFEKERKAFGKPPSELKGNSLPWFKTKSLNVNVPKTDEEFWAQHSVVIVEEKEPIEVFKQRKSFVVKQAFLNWRKTATLFSSLGFKADSGERANTDVSGLLVAYEDNRDALIMFRDADNEFHSLTYAQVKTLQKEIVENGNYAYAQKWAFDAQVDSATTKEELDAIQIEFVGKDFSEVTSDAQ